MIQTEQIVSEIKVFFYINLKNSREISYKVGVRRLSVMNSWMMDYMHSITPGKLSQVKSYPANFFRYTTLGRKLPK